MNIRELRIGNILNNGEHYCVVIKIDAIEEVIQTTKLKGSPSFFESTPIKAVPLTDDWLTKFGFNEVGDKVVMVDSSFHSIQIIQEGNVLLWDDSGDSISLNDIKYVHQLQNLYFALTGEELTIKEDDNH